MSTFGELRTVDISEYKSDSLRVMQDSLNRYLGKKKHGQSKMNDDEFQKSREILEGKDRLLRAMVMGKKPFASKPFTKEWEKQIMQI